MIKQSSLLRWTLNSKNAGKAHRNWIHHPEVLQSGHVVYLVKFLGKTDAHQSKGIDVIKEGIHKLKFNHQLKRSEGSKIPKVELTVSVNGVAIQDPKTKKICYQYPLHRISYCADDKSDRKFFSFIAKEADSEQHSCFVFISDKLAEEITLTIGQAFDLAYRRFLDTSGREMEMRKNLMLLQKRVHELEKENDMLQKKLQELQQDKQLSRSKIRTSKILAARIVPQKSEKSCPPAIQPPPPVQHRHSEGRLRNASKDLLCDFNDSATVTKRLDNDFLNEFVNLDLRPYAWRTNGNSEIFPVDNGNDLFGSVPFQPSPNKDPFGMSSFGSADLQAQDLDTAIGVIDKHLLEMQDGFKRGISFGNEDFSAACLDSQNK